MYIVCVTIRVKPAHVDDFIRASVDNATNTRKEPGNARFDILQATEDPARFQLYEVYESEEAFKAHQTTAHYARWRDTVADWMAEPRAKVVCRPIHPTDRAAW